MKIFANAGADRTKIDEFERWASGLASTAMGSWGARRGGWIGLLALAGAGFLAWRAGTGQSLIPGQEQPRRAAKRPARRRLAAPRKQAQSEDKAAAKAPQRKRAASAKARAAAKAAPKSDMKASEPKAADTKTANTKTTAPKAAASRSTGTGGEIRASATRTRAKAPRRAKANGAHHAPAKSEAKPKSAPTAHS